MFEQTFVEAKSKAPPYALALSLCTQVLVLAVLLVLPLVYTQVLPGVSLRSVLAAPAPPPVPPPPRSLIRTSAKVQVVRVFTLPTFAVHPLPVTHVEPIAAAPPDMSAAETTGIDPREGIVMSGIPSTAPPIHTTASGPVRIGGGVSEANLIHRVQPLYPPLARTTHVEGTVEFTATISKSGAIENLQLVRGHPLLVNAAREAILQWRYRPTLLNGEPVEVITDIVVKFTLSQGG